MSHFSKGGSLLLEYCAILALQKILQCIVFNTIQKNISQSYANEKKYE